jgi:hypothetical protein
MNPPYSKLKDWMRKAYNAAREENATVVCLIPARTDTKAWHRYAKYGEVRFLEGRLKFGGSKNSAPFSSAIVIFRRPDRMVLPCGLIAQKLDKLHMTPV